MNNTKSNFGKKGWMIIIYVLFLYMFSATPPDTLNVTAGWFGEIIGVETTSLLPFFAIGGFVGIPVAFILGQFIAKKGVKWPTVGILIIYAVIWVLNGFVKSVPGYAVITILLVAVSDAMNLVSTQQTMNNWFPKKKGIALGWSTMGMCFSSALMVPIFSALKGSININAPYNLMAVICIVLAIITAVWFKNYPEEAGAYPDNEPITEEEKQANLKLINEYQSEFTVKKLFRTKELWQLTILFALLFLTLIGITSQMIPRMGAVGFAENTAIMMLTISSLVGIFGSFAWGWIDQKITTKKTVEIFCACWTLMCAVGAIGAISVNKPITIVSVVMYSLLLGGLGNLMPSFTITIFGRYDFPQANKIMVPIVVAIRSFALFIVPAMLAAAAKGGPQTAETNAKGYFMVMLIFTIFALISTIIAFVTKDKMIGKE